MNLTVFGDSFVELPDIKVGIILAVLAILSFSHFKCSRTPLRRDLQSHNAQQRLCRTIQVVLIRIFLKHYRTYHLPV